MGVFSVSMIDRLSYGLLYSLRWQKIKNFHRVCVCFARILGLDTKNAWLSARAEALQTGAFGGRSLPLSWGQRSLTFESSAEAFDTRKLLKRMVKDRRVDVEKMFVSSDAPDKTSVAGGCLLWVTAVFLFADIL